MFIFSSHSVTLNGGLQIHIGSIWQMFILKWFLEVNVFISVNCACFVVFFFVFVCSLLRTILMTVPFISDSVCWFSIKWNKRQRENRKKQTTNETVQSTFFFAFTFRVIIPHRLKNSKIVLYLNCLLNWNY